jgi:3',5'-cyclic-AMP phosphodiesterase
MLKIAQITDIHISSKNELKGDFDSQERLLNVLNDIETKDIDLIIVSGDLVNSPDDTTSYKWLKKHLYKKNKKTIIIPGNHDSSINMSDIFDLKDYLKSDEIYFSIEVENHILAFLDSSKEFISHDQLKWLEDLNDKSNKDIVIFVHHPLDYCNCEFMDRKYPLKNISEVKELLINCKNIKYIFTGHYHTKKQINIGHIKQYITPSTWYQINDNIEGFNISKKYGWREINIDQDSLSTFVHYIKLSH